MKTKGRLPLFFMPVLRSAPEVEENKILPPNSSSIVDKIVSRKKLIQIVMKFVSLLK
jgi:hypothetical protein